MPLLFDECEHYSPTRRRKRGGSNDSSHARFSSTMAHAQGLHAAGYGRIGSCRLIAIVWHFQEVCFRFWTLSCRFSRELSRLLRSKKNATLLPPYRIDECLECDVERGIERRCLVASDSSCGPCSKALVQKHSKVALCMSSLMLSRKRCASYIATKAFVKSKLLAPSYPLSSL